MGKGKLLYSKVFNIKGLDQPFQKELRFDLKNGLFCVNYPSKIVDKDIVSIENEYAKTLNEIEQKFTDKVRLFELVQFDSTTVILYNISEKRSYMDGSGQGFVFNWGIYKKIEAEHLRKRDKFFFLRNYGGKSNEYAFGNDDFNKCKELPWTQNAEDFFIELSNQIDSISTKLEYFVNNISIIAVDNIKLLK